MVEGLQLTFYSSHSHTCSTTVKAHMRDEIRPLMLTGESSLTEKSFSGMLSLCDRRLLTTAVL